MGAEDSPGPAGTLFMMLAEVDEMVFAKDDEDVTGVLVVLVVVTVALASLVSGATVGVISSPVPITTGSSR